MQDRTKQGLINELETRNASQELLDFAYSMNECALHGPFGYEIFDTIKPENTDEKILADIKHLAPISVDLWNRKCEIDEIKTNVAVQEREYNNRLKCVSLDIGS